MAAKRITINRLRKHGFQGPWPHGEYYLFSEQHAASTGSCVIMCAYPPPDENGAMRWALSWNADRGLWASDPTMNITRKARTIYELRMALRESRNLVPN